MGYAFSANIPRTEAENAMRHTRLLSLLMVVLMSFAAGAQSRSRKAPRAPQITSAQRNEAEIRDLYDQWAKVFRAHDLNGIMALYAPGDAVIAYDLIPPLQYVGHESYRKDYKAFLDEFDGPIDIQYRDLHIVAGNDVAFIHAIERMSGTLKDGNKFDVWCRATSGLRKINGKWLIVHDHISVPADFNTGKALMDLKPR